jgi:carbon dioxide concentrating mechanism protein CcmN
MSSLPFHLEPIVTAHYVVMGDVTIGEGSAIAPGVLLQADPGCRIVLGAGVCLGMGCVIHASGGAIQIGRGVNLGAGVLVVGASTIGDRALVGAGTTVFGQSIEPGDLIAPSSLLMGSVLIAAPNGPPNAPPNAPVADSKTDTNATVSNSTDRVNVESNGYFYAKSNGNKSNGKVPTPDTIADPWASEPVAPLPTVTPLPTTVNPTTVNPSIVPPIGTPIVSTYVYPDETLLPKHPWEINANTDLGSPTDRVNPHSLHSPQPNPDSDISAAEMQHAEPAPNSPQSSDGSSELAPRHPKQVYGQTYVNQVLGRMLGKP